MGLTFCSLRQMYMRNHSSALYEATSLKSNVGDKQTCYMHVSCKLNFHMMEKALKKHFDGHPINYFGGKFPI